MAILLVEQYFEFARALADRYVVMERGEVVLSGDADDMVEAMSAAISRSEAQARAAQGTPRFERGDGAAEIVFAPRRLPPRLYQQHALPGAVSRCRSRAISRWRRCSPPRAGSPAGDRLRVSVGATGGARAIVATGAAEKVYRSLGPDADVAVTLAVERRRLARMAAAGDDPVRRRPARRRAVAPILLAAHACSPSRCLVFGRTARGERFRYGKLLRRAGASASAAGWSGPMHCSSTATIGARLDAAAAFAGAVAFATAVYVGEDAAEHLPLARALAEAADSQGGATLVNGVLLARFLGATPRRSGAGSCAILAAFARRRRACRRRCRGSGRYRTGGRG